jgi:hypothetical protein
METEIKIKRNIKDSVFSHLFRDPKYLLQLYKALHPEDTEAIEKDIQNVTIKNVLTDNLYNDLGFMIREKLIILVEAQSTWSDNIMIRALLYAAQSYHEYIRKKSYNLYGSKKIEIPKPELYVIYTGDKKIDNKVLSMKDTFFGGEDCAIEVKVNVICDDSTDNIIGQYVTFCKIYGEQLKQHKDPDKAIKETIRICKDKDVLKEYLSEREKEVVSIMMELFDDDYIMDAFLKSERNEAEQKGIQKGIQKGRQEGIQEGIQKGIAATIEMCREFGISFIDTVKKIADKFGLTEEGSRAEVEKYWYST